MGTSSETAPAQRESSSLEVVERRARLRLLQSLVSRGSSEVAALLIPPVIVFMHWHQESHSSWLLWGWWGVMACMALGLAWLRKSLRFQWQGAEADPADHDLHRWEQMLAVSALINGLCWTLSLPATWGSEALDLRLLVYLILAGVLASGTTFLAPVPRVFGGFFAGLYVPMLLASLGYLGERGTYLFPLLLLYGVVLLRHAWGGWRFIQEQITHERERHVLAERYRKAKLEAEEASADKSWFLAAASHDLRQPLHALGLTLEAARLRNINEDVACLLNEVQTCTRDLNAMFNDLLDLSRLEDGRVLPNVQCIDLASIFAQAQRTFAKDAVNKGLRCSIFLPAHSTALTEADPVLLRQMVFNLLQNALRYTDEGGVLLGLRRRGAHWLIQVWDTGPGIPAEERVHIFMPHYRSADVRQKPVSLRSRGLGLSVVARAAQCMGVEYGVESRQGCGSCFWLKLPCLSAFPASTPQAQPDSQTMVLQGCGVLLDPDDCRRLQLHALLTSWGLDVGSQRSIRELCMEPWLVRAPDFVLSTDMEMLQSLQQQYPSASAALISGDDQALEQAQEDGYLALPMPLSVPALYAVLSSAVRS